MMEQILSMIGLAKKAGKVAIGEEPVGAEARAKHARVLLVARDAGASSVRRAFSFASAGACLCLTVPWDKEQLGRALGRTSCAMAAVTDIGFAEAIVKKLAALDPQHYSGAAGQLEVKAKRAAQRRQEKLQHEKNVQQGKKKKKETVQPPAAAAEEKKCGDRSTGRPHSAHRRPAGKRRPRTEAPRFAGSRPVKKGKGSVKKKK